MVWFLTASVSERSAAVRCGLDVLHDDKTNQSHGGWQAEHALLYWNFTWSKYPDNKSGNIDIVVCTWKKELSNAYCSRTGNDILFLLQFLLHKARTAYYFSIFQFILIVCKKCECICWMVFCDNLYTTQEGSLFFTHHNVLFFHWPFDMLQCKLF